MCWKCRDNAGNNAYRTLMGNPLGKRLPARLRRRWEDKIKMGLRRQVMGIGGGCSWLMFLYNGEFSYWRR
jgi:hypothetical protein